MFRRILGRVSEDLAWRGRILWEMVSGPISRLFFSGLALCVFGFILLAHNDAVMIPLNGLILTNHTGATIAPLFLSLSVAFFAVYVIEMAFYAPYVVIRLAVNLVRGRRKPRHEEPGSVVIFF